MSEKAAMDSIYRQPHEREEHRVQANREELIERITRAVRQDGRVEPLRGLRLHRVSSPTEPVHGVSSPAFCVIAQGSKEIHLGDSHHRYDPYHYLLVTAEMPVVSQIIEASPERPYLSFLLELDPTLVGSVMVEAGHFSPRGQANVRAINVSPLGAGLLDAMVRLARILDTPAQAPFLAPLIMREIIYRLLMGEQGDRLCHIALRSGYTHRIADFEILPLLYIRDPVRGVPLARCGSFSSTRISTSVFVHTARRRRPTAGGGRRRRCRFTCCSAEQTVTRCWSMLRPAPISWLTSKGRVFPVRWLPSCLT